MSNYLMHARPETVNLNAKRNTLLDKVGCAISRAGSPSTVEAKRNVPNLNRNEKGIDPKPRFSVLYSKLGVLNETI